MSQQEYKDLCAAMCSAQTGATFDLGKRLFVTGVT
jgi:hypothetical protein